MAENLFWAICRKLQKLVQQMDDVPEELQGLDELLSDTYFCNFSLFQSMPDSWAIKQLFPVMPIHRLNEQPTRPRRARRHHLRLRRQDRSVHRPPRRQAHAAAAPLQRRAVLPRACSWSAPIRRSSATCTTCSATPTPCTSASTSDGSVVLDAVIKGDTVREVLDYVEFDADDADRASCAPTSKRAVRAGRHRLRGIRPAAASSTKTG